MKTTNDNHDARISCEETFTEDMGPATWANKPEMPDMVSIDKAFGDFAKACDKAVGKCQDFIDMDVTDKADRRKPTYELWYLGDRCNSLVKCRESFNKLLIDAAELMRCGREAGLSVGGIEICCVSADGRDVETVWHHNHADDKKKKVAR